MQELTKEQIKKLEKLSKVIDHGNIAVVEHLFEIEEKMEDQIYNLNKVFNSIKGNDGEKGEKGDRGEKGEKGEKGQDGKDGKDGRDGRDGRDGKDGEMGIIDEATIGFLENEIKRVEAIASKSKYTRDGIGVVIRGLVAGNNISIDSSNMEYPVITGTGGGPGGLTVETPTGTVNGSNASFTVTAEPQWVISDGLTYFDGAGYTYGALTITMDVAPSQYIRAIS